MADFTTTLAAPQGAGANPVAPVQEHQVPFQPNPLLEAATNIFAKGLVQQRQQDALDRKNAVVGEYVKAQNVYTEALTSGQWTAAQVATASRANHSKFAAAYPEYITEFSEARKSLIDGGELGEVQRKVQETQKRRTDDIDRASQAGWTFYDGISPTTEDSFVAAHKAQVRLDKETEDRLKANAEDRAQQTAQQSKETHQITLQNYVDKQNAEKGVLDVADKNFDALRNMSRDFLADPKMPYEKKVALFADRADKMRIGLQAIARSNPELAAPWSKIIDDMQSTFTKLADPKAKSENEAAVLHNELNALMDKQKLMIVSKPEYRKAVAVSQLFGNNSTLINLTNSNIVTGMLADLSLGPDGGSTNPNIVGTPNEKDALVTLKGALSSLQKGSANGDPKKNATEAVNAVNGIMKQTATVGGGSIPATTLKGLSAFYSSPEFGKLSEQGQLDRNTMQNANKVFQINYVPAVTQAVEGRLLQTIDYAPARGGAPFRQGGQRIIDNVDIKFNGSGITFVEKPGAQQTISSYSTTQAIQDAEKGLNEVIRIGAHMEGTTNYAKYWDENKHLLMPRVFPDPNKLKVGQIIKAKNGKSYKYIGGDYNNISASYVEVPNAGQGE